MNQWKALRERAGLTLAELSAKSGYSIGTINGLELHGEGSQRLKNKLTEILTPLSTFEESVSPGRVESVIPPVALREVGPEYTTVAQCKARIKELEQQLAELRIALRVQAREINSAPPSDAATLARRAGELSDQSKPRPPS